MTFEQTCTEMRVKLLLKDSSGGVVAAGNWSDYPGYLATYRCGGDHFFVFYDSDGKKRLFPIAKTCESFCKIGQAIYLGGETVWEGHNVGFFFADPVQATFMAEWLGHKGLEDVCANVHQTLDIGLEREEKIACIHRGLAEKSMIQWACVKGPTENEIQLVLDDTTSEQQVTNLTK